MRRILSITAQIVVAEGTKASDYVKRLEQAAEETSGTVRVLSLEVIDDEQVRSPESEDPALQKMLEAAKRGATLDF